MVLFHILIQFFIWIFDFKSLMFPLFSFIFLNQYELLMQTCCLCRVERIYVLNTQWLVLSLKIVAASVILILFHFFYPQLIYTPWNFKYPTKFLFDLTSCPQELLPFPLLLFSYFQFASQVMTTWILVTLPVSTNTLGSSLLDLSCTDNDDHPIPGSVFMTWTTTTLQLINFTQSYFLFLAYELIWCHLLIIGVLWVSVSLSVLVFKDFLLQPTSIHLHDFNLLLYAVSKLGHCTCASSFPSPPKLLPTAYLSSCWGTFLPGWWTPIKL